MTHISSRVASWMNHCKKSHCILSEEWRAESINKTHVVVVKSRRVINATKTRLSRSHSSREGNVSGLRGSGVTVQTARCSGSLCHAKIVVMEQLFVCTYSGRNIGYSRSLLDDHLKWSRFEPVDEMSNWLSVTLIDQVLNSAKDLWKERSMFDK